MDRQKFKWQAQIIIISVLCFILCPVPSAEAKTFKVASYNVENLFDLNENGTEYTEYIPNNIFGWNTRTLDRKLNNIAKVIKDLSADVVALQEIESDKALMLLRNKLKTFNVDYPFAAIADSEHAAVQCALLSRFPVVSKEEICTNNAEARNILKITINVDGTPFLLFVNHWKSKRGPESERIACAKTLRKEIDKLKGDTDFILIGDFNSNYNEHETFRNSRKLNDTAGETGINHILGTIKDSKMVDENILLNQTQNKYLYNLWLEINEENRWSYQFSNKKNSPDCIIVGKGLYDKQGISYIDNSFDKFASSYLFKTDSIYRWQRTKKGTGKHMGQGYSDHLPVFAYFSTKAFRPEQNYRISYDGLPLKQSKKAALVKGRVDLNTATRKELQAIKGIGPVLAKRIIAARPYASVDELLKVKGIGKKKLKTFRRYFVIGQK